MILLASGLSLTRESSFTLQLRLLARGLRRRGCACVLVGVAGRAAPPRRLGGPAWDLPAVESASVQTVAPGARAAVLLGYPEQLALLDERGGSREPGEPASARAWSAPLFLWAQFSRPPERAALGPALPVPLTEATRSWLSLAGCERIGPTIPHAVDTAVLRPLAPPQRRAARRRLGIEARAFVVGTVGANTHRKRFDRLLAAVSRLPASSVLLLKTDRLRAAGGFDLPALAEGLGIAGRVRLVAESLPAASLARLYACMDVYAHAAEWEGFGIPVAEALACGVPVACAATQGPAEIVPYEDLVVSEGEWVEEGGSRLFWVEPAALAETLAKAAADGGLRERLASAGRAHAVRSFDPEVVCGRWLELLLGREPLSR